MLLRLCFILTLVSYCCLGKGQVEAAVEKDSVLLNYIRQCKTNAKSPAVLKMCDTLSSMAKERGDEHAIVVAECLKLDYYYYNNKEEGILKYVESSKDISRKYNQLKYYYFVWGSRLISYYIKANKVNIALYEIKKMLQEAQKDNYSPGLVECYRSMSVVYLTLGNSQKAYENIKKVIEIINNNQIEDINLPTYYGTLAQTAIELKLWDEAEEALKTGLPLASTSYQVFTVKKAYALFYLAKEDFKKAKQYIDELEVLFQKNKGLSIYLMGFYFVVEEYYQAVGQYDKALAMVEIMRNDTTPSRSKYWDYKLILEKGELYWSMGDKAKAGEFFRDYMMASDSLRNKEIQNSATEFSSILDVEQLKNEKNELLLNVQKKQLYITYLLLAFLLVFSVVGTVSFFRIYNLHKRLKISDEKVQEQNKELMGFAEELRDAKERAEHASMMKTNFIQNMSHEIRTPLNSIVGFSQILVDMYQDNPETKEFASIIGANCANLLRLINDVLDISFLDQSEVVPYNKIEDINLSCYTSMEAVRLLVKEDVEFKFQPSCENLFIKTNTDRVSQVLTHLLQNAAKFTEKGSIVLDYEVRKGSQQIVYRVTDTGKGIPIDKQEFVFERFTKLDDFTQGTGLGLSICRLIAEKLGGTLVIDSEYTAGCRFILTLPLIYA